MAARYVREQGDLVWVSRDPQLGHEQRGRSPALVLSPRAYNAKAGLVVLLPITSHARGYPFEVPLPAEGDVTGVVLADQVMSVDWSARQVRRAGRAPERVVASASAKLGALVPGA